MWYLLEHKDTKGTMFYDELSDYLFWNGWRIKREAKTSEINIYEFDAIRANLEAFNQASSFFMCNNLKDL